MCFLPVKVKILILIFKFSFTKLNADNIPVIVIAPGNRTPLDLSSFKLPKLTLTVQQLNVINNTTTIPDNFNYLYRSNMQQKTFKASKVKMRSYI